MAITIFLHYFEFDYDSLICSLDNFSMCLWTPYKGAMGWLKFDQRGVQETKKPEHLYR